MLNNIKYNIFSFHIKTLLIYTSLITLCKSTLSHSIISIPFEIYIHFMYINVRTLTKENHLYLPIDLTSSFSYYLNPQNKTHITHPPCINESSLIINNKTFHFFEYQEQISLEEPSRIVTRLPLFNYYIFESSFYNPKRPSNVWAFGPYIKNSLHSITRSLKNGRYIQLNSFAFLYEKDNLTYQTKGGRIFFGGIESQILNTFKYKSHMNINKDFIDIWNCNISYIFWNYGKYKINNEYNNKIHNPYIAYFDTLTEYIELPFDIYAYIEVEYLGKYIHDGKCKKYKYGFKEYSCDCSIISLFDDLIFLIDNVAYIFTYKNLFFHYNYYCVFVIVRNDNLSSLNAIILGNKFLSKYISEFNYNSTTNSFYSKNKFIHSYKGIKYFINISKCIFISSLISISLLIVTILNCFINYNIKHK